MNDFMPKKSYDLTEITRLLLEMRENCIPKVGDAYEDPNRTEKYDALNAAIDLINNPSMISRWISVKDRLPENEETVLISAVRKCANGKHWNVVMTAFYTDGKLHTEDSSFAWDSDCVKMEYCEETDDYIIPEGWWEAVECGDEFSTVDLFVTHWMPLPEPPKGE